MPKITVEENYDAPGRKNDIWLARHGRNVLSEPQALPVQGGPNAPLYPRVFPFDTRHAQAALFSCEIIRHQALRPRL